MRRHGVFHQAQTPQEPTDISWPAVVTVAAGLGLALVAFKGKAAVQNARMVAWPSTPLAARALQVSYTPQQANQQFKLPGWALSVGRGFGALALATPKLLDLLKDVEAPAPAPNPQPPAMDTAGLQRAIADMRQTFQASPTPTPQQPVEKPARTYTSSVDAR